MPFLKNVAMQVSRSYTPYTPEQRELWVWGENTYGLLGNNTSMSELYLADAGSGWATGSDKYVVLASDSAIAIKNDNTIWAYGRNTIGQLGLNDTTPRSNFVQIGTDSDWDYVFAHPYETVVLAIKTNGSLWAWGDNTWGQIGDNTTTNRSSPVQISSDTWSQVAVGTTHVIARKQDGTLWAWGLNTYGQLGNNTNVNTSSPVQIGTLNTWTNLGTSGETSHGIQSNGTLWSWGRNAYGNLGLRLGSSISRSSPTQVGTLTNWSKVFSQPLTVVFALKTDGTLWAWGNNINGVHGDGTVTSRSSPVQVAASGHDFVSIKTIINNTSLTFSPAVAIGLKSNGSLWIWGDSGVFLGAGTALPLLGVPGPTADSRVFDPFRASSPVQIGSYTDIKQIDIGFDTSLFGPRFLALNANGEFFSAGFNRQYNDSNEGISQIPLIKQGIESGIVETTPVLLDQGTQWEKVSIGDFHAAAIKNGTLWTWGYNSFGQLGIGDSINRSSPVQVGADSTWVDVSVGLFNTFAIKTDGTLWAWGTNLYGILGKATNNFTAAANDTLTGVSSPVQVGTDTNWLTVKTNLAGVPQFTTTRQSQLVHYGSYALALKTNGTLWGWGLSASGCLPGLNAGCSFQPHSMTGVSAVSSNQDATYVIKTDGTLWAWGRFIYNLQAGSSIQGTNSPVQIGANTWKQIRGISITGFAIRSDDTLWAWGTNLSGRAGTNLGSGNISSPIQIGTSTWSYLSKTNPAAQCEIATMHAIRSDGTLWGWGDNTSGQIGDNTVITRSSPVQIGTDTDWKDVTTSLQHALAVKTNGTLWAWGYNFYGELGDNTATNRSSPVQIGADTNWDKVFTLGDTSYGIKTNGTLWGWGYNSIGQIGNNSVTIVSSPVQVGSDTDWDHISGMMHSRFEPLVRAQKTNGTMYAWGYSGQNLTNITLTPLSDLSRSTPVQIESSNTWMTKSVSSFGDDVYGGFMAIDTSNNLYFMGGGRTQGASTARTAGNGVSAISTYGIHIQRPTQITGSWVFVDAGNGGGVGIKSDGTMWAWGRHGLSGHMGPDGKDLNKTTNYVAQSPIQIGDDNTWINATFGEDQIFAVKTNGTLWAIGRNTYGSLGVNDTTSRSSPTQIGSGTNWKAVKSRYYSTLAVKNDGTLWAWGTNHSYLTDSSVGARISSPVQIGTDTNWSDIDIAFGNYAAVRYISGSA